MLDKGKITANFSKSAKDYDRHALLQQGMADSLFQTVIKYAPKNILDIGCGTGCLAAKLAGYFPAAEVIGIDLSPEMVRIAKAHYPAANLRFLEGDGEQLPFPDNTFDLVISNASFQWMDFGKAAEETRRTLKPGGRLMFTTFGPKTLQELRQLGFRVNPLLSVKGIKKILGRAFIGKEFSAAVCAQTFDSIKSAIKHLKNIGAQTAGAAAGQKLKISALKKEKGKFAVTFEIIYCCATKKS